MATPKILTSTASGTLSKSFPTDIPETANYAFYLENVTISLSSAPSSSGNITVTLDSATDPGSQEYDVVLVSIDPSVHPTLTDFVYTPDSPLLCVSGDQIKVEYSNPNSRTWGLRVVGKSI